MASRWNMYSVGQDTTITSKNLHPELHWDHRGYLQPEPSPHPAGLGLRSVVLCYWTRQTELHGDVTVKLWFGHLPINNRRGSCCQKGSSNLWRSICWRDCFTVSVSVNCICVSLFPLSSVGNITTFFFVLFFFSAFFSFQVHIVQRTMHCTW